MSEQIDFSLSLCYYFIQRLSIIQSANIKKRCINNKTGKLSIKTVEMEILTMNQNDLRVKKTKKAIHNTFMELLKVKPISKISVTELAKAAEINKATFYLHYKDIFDLYQHTLRNFLCDIAAEITFMDLFFTDIERFATKLYELSINRGFFKNNVLFSTENASYNQGAMQFFCNALTEKVISLNVLEDTDINRMKLRYIFAGIGMLFRFDSDKKPEDIILTIVCAYKGQFWNLQFLTETTNSLASRPTQLRQVDNVRN